MATVFPTVAILIPEAARADADRVFPIGRAHNPDWPIMKLDPDEKKLVESFERGEWKPVDGGEIARMRELARNQLRADVRAGFNSLARGEGRRYDKRSGRRLAASVKARGRATQTKKR
jgi:hypothetical protein